MPMSGAFTSEKASRCSRLKSVQSSAAHNGAVMKPRYRFLTSKSRAIFMKGMKMAPEDGDRAGRG